MMKFKFFGLFLLCLFTSLCIAQEEAPLAEKRPPFLIAQTGIGLQWFGETFKLATFSLEKPLKSYVHLGIQGNLFLNDEGLGGDYYNSEFQGGYEVGLFYKYFLHGRFSGRRTGLYLGPELRFGSRQYRYIFGNQFPPPPSPIYIYYRDNTTKVLLRWGLQWQFGHANLELCAPIGVEFNKSQAAGGTEEGTRRLMLLPTLQLGIAL